MFLLIGQSNAKGRDSSVGALQLAHIGDSLHYNGAGLMAIGERMARKYLEGARAPIFYTSPAGPALLSVPGEEVEIEVSGDLVVWKPREVRILDSFHLLEPTGAQKFFRLVP